MFFPLGLRDVSLWLAATALIALVTSETLSSYYGRTNLRINQRRLKNTAIAVSILSLATFALKVLDMLG